MNDTRPLNDNIRGLIDTAKNLAVKAASSKSPQIAVQEVFSQRFSATVDHNPTHPEEPAEQPHPDSLPRKTPLPNISPNAVYNIYEHHKDLIIRIYLDREQRVNPTIRVLEKKHGIHLTRQTVTKYLKEWGYEKD